MLVMDPKISASLFAVAADEGWAWHAGDKAALYRDRMTSNFLAKGRDVKLRQQALWDLLLHYPAVVCPCDNLDLSGLQDIGLVKGALDVEGQNLGRSELHDSPESVRDIEALVLADMEGSHPAIMASKPIDTFLRVWRSRGCEVAHRLDSACFDMFDTFEGYVDGMKSMFGDGVLSLPGRGKRETTGKEFAASLVENVSREDFLAFKAYQPFAPFANDFAMSAHRWLTLTSLGRSLGAVMSADIPRRLLQSEGLSRQGAFLRQAGLGAQQGSTHVVVQIWLDAVECMPALRTIEDVLRLREDPRINAFRAAMVEWTEALASGSPAEEARLRDNIRTTNQALRTLPHIEKFERFWSFASIAVDVLLSPFLHNLPITGIIGVAASESKQWLARKQSWVMFGSRS